MGFDVYNTMTEYLAGKQNGIHSAEELAAMYQALLDFEETLPAEEVFPSTAYRRAISASARATKLTGTVSTISGTGIEITGDVIAENSVTISGECMPDGYLIPGGVPTFELSADFTNAVSAAELYAAEITLSFHILLPSTEWYEIPLGTFTCAGAAYRSGRLRVLAYDDMKRLDSIRLSQLGITAGQAYTPQEIITLIAEAADIAYEEDVSEFTNAARGYILSDLAQGTIQTARDLLSHTVQIICAFAYVDRFRRLRIVPITSGVPDIISTEATRTSTEIERTEYRTYELDTVFSYPGEDGSMQVTAFSPQTFWADGVTVNLPENALFPVMASEQQYRAGRIMQCLNNIVSQLDGVTFTPLTAALFGDPSIEPYEWHSFVSGGETIAAPITASEWRYGSEHTVSACGTDAIAGLVQSRAEKQALAARIGVSQASDNATREMYLRLIQSTGHAGMAIHTHTWLAHFTHGELGGTE